MSDSLTRILPYEPSEITSIETWLNEMAAKGLILEDITFIFASFKKTKPCCTRFRIDFSPRKDRKKDSARRSFFKELGWQFVTIFSDRYTIYKTDDPLLTDFPSEHAAVHSPTNWKQVAGTIALVIALQIAVFYFGYTDRRIGIFDTLVHDASLGAYLLLIIVPFKVIAFKLLKAREKRAALPSRNRPTSSKAILQVIKKIILPVSVFFLCMGIQSGFQVQKAGALQNASDHIPFPLLEEINSEGGKSLSDGLKSDEFDVSYMTREHRLLAPLTIQTIQAGPCLQTDENKHISRCYYRVNYYRVLSGQLAKWYAAELSQNERSNQISDASSDFHAWYYKTEDSQSLIVQYQNIVMDILYYGATDLRDCIPLYEAYLGINQGT